MIWIRISSMRKPRRWSSAAWRKDDRITSAVCLSCWLFEPLNQGKVYEKPVVGVSNSLFLLRFSYYKSAVRNKCFTCDLILCRHKHLGSTRRPGSLRRLKSSRDLINELLQKRRVPRALWSPFTFLAIALWMLKESMNSKAVTGPEPWGLAGSGRLGSVRVCGSQSIILLERSSSSLLRFFMPPLLKKSVI